MTSKQARLFQNDIVGYLFVLPSLAAILFFTVYPVIEALRVSFYQYANGVPWRFSTYNYQFIFSDDRFWTSMKNTFYMGFMNVALIIPISLIIATIINNCNKGKNFFKSLFFIPNVTSMVAVSLIFVFVFYSTEAGIVNAFLGIFGIQPLKWFSSPALAPVAIVLMSVWHGVGYNIIIWIAALQSIPKELYEAASMDGATRLKQWVYITIPGIKPIIAFMVIMSSIGALKRFSDVFIIGGVDGVPASSLSTLVVYIYKHGFVEGDYGKAAAASYITFITILIVTIFNFRLNKNND